MKSSDCLTQDLQAICAAVQIKSADLIVFAGKPYSVDPLPDLAQADISQERTKEDEFSYRWRHLIHRLTRLIYKHGYIRSTEFGLGGQGAETESCQVSEKPPAKPLRLREANHTQDAWDHGWKVYHIANDGRAFVQKADRTRVVVPGTFYSPKMLMPSLKIGDEVGVRVFASTAQEIETFFHSFGSYLSDQFDEFTKLRFYFHVKAASAESLLAQLSTILNRYRIPFHFKTLGNSEAYTRADAAVLYVAKRYMQIVAALIPDIVVGSGASLGKEIPMFTKWIMPGVGMAEEVSDEESFGMHRSRLVAEALVYAWTCGHQDQEQKMEAIAQSFAEKGICLEQPYLNPQSIDLLGDSESVK